MTDKNEHINLWILDRDRKENKAKLEKEMARLKQSERHRCPKCKNGFQEPKLIQYYVCPNCESRFEHELEQSKEVVNIGSDISLKRIAVNQFLQNV